MPDKDHPALAHPWLYFGAGVALAVGLHAAVGGLLGLSALLASWAYRSGLVTSELQAWLTGPWILWLMGTSLFQVLYLGPAGFIAWRWRPPMALGILTVAVLTVLLQGSCYGFFLLALGA